MKWSGGDFCRGVRAFATCSSGKGSLACRGRAVCRHCGARELAALIKPTAPTLTSLAMSEAEIADAASPALFQVIGTGSKLEHLDLCGNPQLRSYRSMKGARGVQDVQAESKFTVH